MNTHNTHVWACFEITLEAEKSYETYYLWFLAGEGRTQGVTLDPKVGWVQKTVGMI